MSCGEGSWRAVAEGGNEHGRPEKLAVPAYALLNGRVGRVNDSAHPGFFVSGYFPLAVSSPRVAASLTFFDLLPRSDW